MYKRVDKFPFLECPVLLVFLLFASSANTYGEERTIELTAEKLGLTGSYNSNTKTVDGVTFCYEQLQKSGTVIQAQSNTGFLQNSSAIPGRIKSVMITRPDNASNCSVTVSFGSSYGSINETRVSGSDTDIITPNGNYSYIKFSSGSNTSYWKCITINYEPDSSIPTHKVYFSVNGTLQPEEAIDVKEGDDIPFPDDVSDIGNYKFVGWYGSQYSNSTVAPQYVSSAKMGSEDVTYYAVYALLTLDDSSWGRVLSLSDITEGTYIIKNGDYVLSNEQTNSSPTSLSAPTVTDNTISKGITSNMEWIFTKTSVDNQFTIKNPDGKYLYSQKDASQATQAIRVGNTSDKWTFAENTETYFCMKSANNSRYCAKYKLSTAYDWRSYESATHTNYTNGGKLELYKKGAGKLYSNYCTNIPTQTLNLVAQSGKYYYATFCNSNAVEFTDETTKVYALNINGDDLMLNEVASKQVPADTGILIKSAISSANYIYIDSANPLDNNLLRPATEAMEGNCYFLKLAYDDFQNRTGLGFFFANVNGEPFTCKAGTAYLAIPKSQQVKSFIINDEETTKIKDAPVSNLDPSAPAYNMMGQQVNPTCKGIIIQNGKKYAIK